MRELEELTARNRELEGEVLKLRRREAVLGRTGWSCGRPGLDPPFPLEQSSQSSLQCPRCW
jgi:hypothetical protein